MKAAEAANCPHGRSRGDCPRCWCWPTAALLALMLTGCLHSGGPPTVGNLDNCEVDLAEKRATMTAIEATAKTLCGSPLASNAAVAGLCVLAPAVEWLAGVVHRADPVDCETARHAVAVVEHCEQAYEHAKYVVERAEEVAHAGPITRAGDVAPAGPPGPDELPAESSPPPEAASPAAGDPAPEPTP